MKTVQPILEDTTVTLKDGTKIDAAVDVMKVTEIRCGKVFVSTVEDGVIGSLLTIIFVSDDQTIVWLSEHATDHVIEVARLLKDSEVAEKFESKTRKRYTDAIGRIK